MTGIIKKVNDKVGDLGCCSYIFKRGDDGWRCMDCEKDETCIMCKSCFEKADHVQAGHRVILQRDVLGSCDCGDPEDYDPDHFCSDHKGKLQSAEQMLSKLPEKIRTEAQKKLAECCIDLK